MRHKFTHTIIPEGQEEIIETCVNGCGAKVIRDRRGRMTYISPKTGNKVSGENKPECVKSIVSDLMSSDIKIVPSSILKSNEAIILADPHIKLILENNKLDERIKREELVISNSKILQEIYKPKHQFANQLTQQEATLKDALTIIQVMYKDMMKNDLETNGTRMARRMLSSQGYEDVVKLIESKLSK